VPQLPYRVLAEVPAADLGPRTADARPAALDLDFGAEPFAALGLTGPVDLDSLQVLRYDPATGQVLPTPPWPFGRTKGERASRFLDKSLPWDFPESSSPLTPGSAVGAFPRGAYLANAKGTGNPGLLVWDHQQDGRNPSHYAVYFGSRPAGERPHLPRQGFLGDGSPRREPQTQNLTGSLYNRCAVDDWDGDGLSDILVGIGFGKVLLFRNLGDRTRPAFDAGEYLLDAAGQILDVGFMASPAVADWDGDGARDLLVGEEGIAGVFWYRNLGTSTARRLEFRGRLQADGQDLVVPSTPCPESPHYTKDYAPAVEAVDWDGDGDTDLLLGGYITGRIWYYENAARAPDGTPVLAFRGPLEADGTPIDTIWGAHPCAVDLDGDGDLDLLSGSFGQRVGGGDQVNRFLFHFENLGTRQAPRLTEHPVVYAGPEPQAILAQARPADLNGDGLTDLVISSMSAVHLALNVGDRAAPRWQVDVLPGTWGLAPLSVSQLIDWDGDGDVDFVQTPLDSDGTPQVLLNRGQGAHGVFDPARPALPAGQMIRHPAPYGDPWAYTYFHDVDRDGDLDLLWADGPGHIYLHRNTGSAQTPAFDTAGERLTTTAGDPIKVGPPVVPVEQITDFTVMQGSRAAVAAADFDGDGLTDLAVGDTFGDVYHFRNVGTNAAPRFATGDKLGNLASRAVPFPYDWDADGRPDVLGVAWSGQMAWYRNLGPTAQPPFAPGQPLNLPPTVPYSPRVVVGDWNGDGDDDFLVMSSYPWFCWLDGSYVRHGYAEARLVAVEARPVTAGP
jgi:hypothetical protein